LNPFDADPVSSSPAATEPAAGPRSQDCTALHGDSVVEDARQLREPSDAAPVRPSCVPKLDLPAAGQLATNRVSADSTWLPLVSGMALCQPSRSLRRNSL
jgi:hypothetical protein